MTKRKLTLLPEVLPQPRAAQSADAPRARTMEHLRRLVATAAALGAASTACGKERKPPDPAPSAEPLADAAVPSAYVPPAADPTPPSTMGYAVVDPMPPPAHCDDVTRTMPITARFESDAVLVFDLHVPAGRGDFKFVKDATPRGLAVGANVVSSKVTASAATVRVGVPANATEVTIAVSAFCKNGPTTIAATARWSGAPGAGTKARAQILPSVDALGF